MAVKRLTDEQLMQMLELARKSDSVELKLTVPPADHRTAIAGLGLDPLEAQIRQVFFFDTPAAGAQRQRASSRARGGSRDARATRSSSSGPSTPTACRTSFGSRRTVGVEVDAMPGGYVCSATLKAKADAPDVRAVALGKASIRSIFSKEQRAFYAAHAPDGLKLKDLSVLGPIFVLKQNFTPPELARRLTAELWFYPDGSRILELSTKCTAADAFQVAAEARFFLTEKGVSLTAGRRRRRRRR